MKNSTKKVVAGIIITVGVLGLSVNSISAMGKGDGQGFGSHGQNKHSAAQNKQSGHDKDSGKMLEGVALQDLSSIEIDLLEKQYEEEMMANELYTFFYEMYGIETFKNIAASESKHMEAVATLFERYNLELPSDYNHIEDLYNELKAAGSISLFDALEVGVKIEFIDIDDIVKAITSSDNDDIKIVFTNIGGASYNHLRGFLKAIDNNDFSTDLDYSNYISEDDLSVKGPLKYKLAERLEREGVELPEQVSSESMKNKKCDDEGHQNNSKKEQVKTLKNTYKTTYQEKYGSLIATMDDDKLEILIEKIDNLSIKVRNGEYSESVKIKYSSMLQALREIAVENLD